MLPQGSYLITSVVVHVALKRFWVFVYSATRSLGVRVAAVL